MEVRLSMDQIKNSIDHEAMCKDIAALLQTSLAFEVIDMHTDTREKLGYRSFSHKEAVGMAQMLGKIYRIVHGWKSGCCVGKKYSKETQKELTNLKERT